MRAQPLVPTDYFPFFCLLRGQANLRSSTLVNWLRPYLIHFNRFNFIHCCFWVSVCSDDGAANTQIQVFGFKLMYSTHGCKLVKVELGVDFMSLCCALGRQTQHPIEVGKLWFAFSSSRVNPNHFTHTWFTEQMQMIRKEKNRRGKKTRVPIYVFIMHIHIGICANQMLRMMVNWISIEGEWTWWKCSIRNKSNRLYNFACA